MLFSRGQGGRPVQSKCPICQARPVNNPRVQFLNPPCDLCGGRGFVDPDDVCKCGRPAVHTANKLRVCTRWECGKAAVEAKQ